MTLNYTITKQIRSSNIRICLICCRYMAIVLKHGRRLSLRAARILISCLWITAISIGLFPILFWGKYYYTERSTLCKPKDGHFMLFLAIICFVIPLSIMIFCYVNVFLKIRQHKKIIMQSQIDRSRFKAEFKTTKIVFTVLAVFLALWTPYTVLYVSSTNSSKADSIPPVVFKFCGFLTAFHSVCNSMIYFTMTKNFRGTAIKLLRRISTNVESETATESYAIANARCSTNASTLQTNKEVLHARDQTNRKQGDLTL